MTSEEKKTLTVLWTDKVRNFALFRGAKGSVLKSPLGIAKDMDKGCRTKFYDERNASVAVPPTVLHIGTYTRYELSRPEVSDGVTEVYVPIQKRLDTLDTEFPIVVAIGKDCLRIERFEAETVADTIEKLLSQIGDFNADYLNRVEYFHPETLKHEALDFYVQGHREVRGGIDYSRYLLGVPRVPPYFQDRNTETWRRRLSIVKLGRTFGAEKGGMVTEVFKPGIDPLVHPDYASKEGMRLPYFNAPWRRDTRDATFLWSRYQIYKVTAGPTGEAHLSTRGGHGVALTVFLGNSDLEKLVQIKDARATAKEE